MHHGLDLFGITHNDPDALSCMPHARSARVTVVQDTSSSKCSLIKDII
jgi:hypothetical protein